MAEYKKLTFFSLHVIFLDQIFQTTVNYYKKHTLKSVIILILLFNKKVVSLKKYLHAKTSNLEIKYLANQNTQVTSHFKSVDLEHYV